MRVYSNHDHVRRNTKKSIFTDRRRFLKYLGMLGVLYLIPLSACKRLKSSEERPPDNYKLSKMEKQVIEAVMLHILPTDGMGPGALDVNSPDYFEFVLKDKHLLSSKKKLLIAGIRWTEETADEMFNNSFVDIDSEQKEKVLRDLETYANGEKWLSHLLNYVFESLLGAPAYNINTNQKGWNWLEHSPGFPQPTSENIYGTYGYGL